MSPGHPGAWLSAQICPGQTAGPPRAWLPSLASVAAAQGSAGLCPGKIGGRVRSGRLVRTEAQQRRVQPVGGLAHPQMLLYPVLLVHDLPLPLHQACCRASALQLWLWLEGSLGLWVVALGKGTGVKSVAALETGTCGSTHCWDGGGEVVPGTRVGSLPASLSVPSSPAPERRHPPLPGPEGPDK